MILNILLLKNLITAENFAARLKQADLAKKTDFDNKLSSFSRQITSHKTKHLEVQKKLDSLITKDYNFFKGEFILQVVMDLKTSVYQPSLDALELKKAKVPIMFLVGNQREYTILNLSHNILSYIA